MHSRQPHLPPAGIMHRAATKIQKITRAFFGRRRFQIKRLDTVIRNIQRVWRGSQCRTSADRAWLNKKVAFPGQCLTNPNAACFNMSANRISTYLLPD